MFDLKVKIAPTLVLGFCEINYWIKKEKKQSQVKYIFYIYRPDIFT